MDHQVTTLREAQRAEVQANYQVFEADLPGLRETHLGKFAAYRHGWLVGIFDDFRTAETLCISRFDDDIFSVQEIVSEPLDIRWFKYASSVTALRPERRGAD